MCVSSAAFHFLFRSLSLSRPLSFANTLLLPCLERKQAAESDVSLKKSKKWQDSKSRNAHLAGIGRTIRFYFHPLPQ